MSAGPVLLLTRPKAQSNAFLELCEARLGRRPSAVVSPIMRIAPVQNMPDLQGETLVVTSSNALHCLSDRLAGRQVATVGKATAALARSFGAKALALGDTAETFLEACQELRPPIVVARGVHARMDLAKELRHRGIDARSEIVYDQTPEPLSPEASRLLVGETPVVAPVFSPRSAKLLSQYDISAPITLLAISQNAADAWQKGGTMRVAREPTAEAMCDLVAEVL